MRLIIDRFEDNYAVCEREDMKIINIKKSKLPSCAKEGDVLIIENNRFIIDIEKTKKLRNNIQKLTGDMWE